MAYLLLNPFDHRQVMQKKDFEIFHYNNSAACSCPPHQHDFYDIFCLLNDRVDYIVDGLRYSLEPGSVMLIAPGQIHRIDVPGPVRDIDRFVLWVSQDYAKSLIEMLPRIHYALNGEIRGQNLIQLDGETQALMRQLFYALHRHAGQPGTDNAFLCRNIISQLLIYCGQSICNNRHISGLKIDPRYHEIIQIYEHIALHFREDLSVTDLARQFFMDKNTLTRQFKRQVGMTPGECIRCYRLEAVRRLIVQGTPAQEACITCGFSDYSAFYRAFRHVYGLSPRDYAARQHGEDALPGPMAQAE